MGGGGGAVLRDVSQTRKSTWQYRALLIVEGVNHTFRKSLSFLIFKLQIYLRFNPLHYFCVYTRRVIFISKPITSKNSNHDIGTLPWIFFAYSFCSTELFLSFLSRKFVIHLFGILRRFGVFILANCCGSFNKFNKYFLRRLDSSLALFW